MPEPSRTAVEIWKLRFRRLYGANTAGLATLADSVACDAAEVVTFTATTEDGSSASGVITGNKLELLQAAEELLADPLFVAGILTPRRRIISPDYRQAQPV